MAATDATVDTPPVAPSDPAETDRFPTVSATRAAITLAGFTLLALVMTFPAPSELATRIPGDNGDAVLNLWILESVRATLFDGWSALWDAGIFHPAENTLAYSESMLPIGVLHAVLAGVTGSPVLSFNLILLATWVGAQWWTYRLALHVTHHHEAALLAALLYAFSAVRLSHLIHFQLAMSCFAPLALLLLVRFLEAPRRRTGIQLGLVLALVTSSASYFGLMLVGSVAIGAATWFVVRRRWPDRERVARLLPGVVVAAVLVGPVAAPYLELQEDPHFRRSPVEEFSAQPQDFFAPATSNHLLADVPFFRDRIADGNIERELFPGFVALALAAVGAAMVVLRRREAVPSAGRPAMWVVVVAGLGMGALSFGDDFDLFGLTAPMPYRILREIVTPLDGIRAPSRFAVMLQLAIAVAAAVGLSSLVRRRRRAALWGTAALAVLVLLESAIVVNRVEVPDDATWTAVNEALADREPGAVVELPIKSGADGALWPYVETPRQYLALIDGNERVNGYSGFQPPDHDETAEILNTFPAPAALALLDHLDVRYVILRTEPVGNFADALRGLLALHVNGVVPEDRAAAMITEAGAALASADKYGGAWLLDLDGG